jgi:hypothetical protein
MLSEERQKDEIRRYLSKKFGANVPADEAKKYSVDSLPDRPNWYGIFMLDLSTGSRHLEVGTEWFEAFPGATVQPSSLTPADIQKAEESSSQFLGKPR